MNKIHNNSNDAVVQLLKQKQQMSVIINVKYQHYIQHISVEFVINILMIEE